MFRLQFCSLAVDFSGEENKLDVILKEKKIITLRMGRGERVCLCGFGGLYPVYVFVLFLNFDSFRLIDMSFICEEFQKFTRAKLNVEIFG